jgi:hypothetical protein
MISSMQSRVFILHSVHADKPTVMTTRWAMSYLRGPLTLSQVRQLKQSQPGADEAEAAPSDVSAGRSGQKGTGGQSRGVEEPSSSPEPGLGYSTVPPQLPSEVEQVYLPVQVTFQSALAAWTKAQGVSVRGKESLEGSLIYVPGLAGLATIYYAHAASRLTFDEEVAYLLPVESEDLDWSAGKVQLRAKELERSSEEDAFFADLPHGLGTAKKLAALKKRFEDFLAFNATFTLRYNPNLKLYSEPGESDVAFQKRCRQAAEKARDEELQELVGRTKKRLDVLEAKLEREERELEVDKDKLSGRKGEELLSGAETVFGLFSGRKKSTALSSASRRRRMTKEAKAQVEESEQAIKNLEAQIADLEEEAKQAEADLTAKWQELMDEVQEIEIRPRRSDVRVNRFALAWIPRWEVSMGEQTIVLAAFEPAISE